MAKIFPEHLPQTILDDPYRAAERKIYQILCELPDPFVVFYSVAWQVRDFRAGARDGEADFILAHPDLGVMIFEVKGGQIRYNATQKQWFSTDRFGVEHEIKDPVEQSRNSKGALLSKLKELPSWSGRYLTISYMVVFPDVVIGQTNLRPDLPRQLVLDASDLNCVGTKVEQGFAWFYGEEKEWGMLGQDRLRLIENFLARSFLLRTPMGIELEHDEKRIIELTQDQMRLLDFIQRQRRALIEGCAGSGKTMLALEKARQLIEQEFETLLLCFNIPLANFLRQRAPAGVDVFPFHELCKQLAKEAGLGYRAYSNQDEYFNQILPDMLFEALTELGPKYDAVIVDEGQDFNESWWDTLIELLRDKEQGIFYVFYDSNQNIYRRHPNLSKLISTTPFTLTENCRNTQTIHQIVKKFHSNPDTLSCRGTNGHAPELFYFSTPHEQEEWVKKALHRLVNEERVAPLHVTLLTTRAPERTPFLPGKKMGNFVLMEWDDLNLRKSDIRVCSVHRFKGLENRVVILTGLEDNDPDWLNPLLYVACSRAHTHLIVVAHERSRAQIEAIFNQL